MSILFSCVHAKKFPKIFIRAWLTKSLWCDVLQHETGQQDLPEMPLPVNIPRVDTAVKTRCYQQPISWREFYVFYPIGMAMKGTYLRLQITSIPQCHSTVITACCKNTGIQEPESSIRSITVQSTYLFVFSLTTLSETYTYISQAVSFLEILLQKLCIHFLFSPCKLQDP